MKQSSNWKCCNFDDDCALLERLSQSACCFYVASAISAEHGEIQSRIYSLLTSMINIALSAINSWTFAEQTAINSWTFRELQNCSNFKRKDTIHRDSFAHDKLYIYKNYIYVYYIICNKFKISYSIHDISTYNGFT